MKLCIIGTGYVGLVSAACFAEMGNTVTCVDVNPEVVKKLNAGSVHIFEPGLEPMVRHSRADGRLTFTTRLEEGIAQADCAFICVGTPPQPDGSCDLSFVRQVAREIGQYMQKDMVVVDKSTVPVGTADEVRGLIDKELKKRGVDLRVDVVSNPEFLKEGDAIADFMKPDRVVIGTDSEKAATLMRELYSPFARTRDKIIVMGVRSAEMTKYAANCMLATKISFINEIATICEQVGADVRDVRTGIGSDSRIGYQFIYPGVGYGGSCFPKDVKALIRTAENAGVEPRLLNAVEAVNARQKKYMAARVEEYFAPQGGVAGKTLTMWGLAFKANTDDMREAAAITIINELTAKGMKIRAFDPVAADNARSIFADNKLVEIVDDQYAACQGAQGLMVVTEWNQFRNPDFEKVRGLLTAPLLFDGRNLYSPSAMAERGFAYFCIGRASV
ncbi:MULTISPECIES: UDP-glucose dehydrogenase family protein [Desulfovibrio]|uniref:UDP-glucose 6-dehydrogenase n=3 Tax=Desulfovibrio TaxID=872 RepID=A0AA94HTN4_DESDE|nr:MULTISPECIES: UDP-glucose/GDP-mannose dehydrogenase family protein [Desulfovibrio]ATD81185.1 UDP-glucose/GDP-mannose dehydrogenase family protein [Desulfovibrio sp. G11]SFW57303.1 UDPglucose 6-dehydrogenase [Desulfovibrio desulfuricans]SPD36811.1 UDP-glucose 6-dehydrogenase [Desulfovibrio sp. G11]